MDVSSSGIDIESLQKFFKSWFDYASEFGLVLITPSPKTSHICRKSCKFFPKSGGNWRVCLKTGNIHFCGDGICCYVSEREDCSYCSLTGNQLSRGTLAPTTIHVTWAQMQQLQQVPMSLSSHQVDSKKTRWNRGMIGGVGARIPLQPVGNFPHLLQPAGSLPLLQPVGGFSPLQYPFQYMAILESRSKEHGGNVSAFKSTRNNRGIVHNGLSSPETPALVQDTIDKKISTVELSITESKQTTLSKLDDDDDDDEEEEEKEEEKDKSSTTVATKVSSTLLLQKLGIKQPAQLFTLKRQKLV